MSRVAAVTAAGNFVRPAEKLPLNGWNGEQWPAGRVHRQEVARG